MDQPVTAAAGGSAPRPALSAAVLAAVAIGGPAGALARYGLGVALPHQPGGFPLTTVAINISGSLAIGVLMAFIATGTRHRLLRPLVGIGFLGGYTTFSTAMVDVRVLIDAGHPVTALVSVVASCAGALAAVFLGWRGTLAVVDRDRG